MSSSHFKKRLLAQVGLVGKALSNLYWLQFIDFIAQGERGLGELAEVSGLTVANTPQQLQQPRRAALVTSRMEGLKVFSTLSGYEVIGLLVKRHPVLRVKATPTSWVRGKPRSRS